MTFVAQIFALVIHSAPRTCCSSFTGGCVDYYAWEISDYGQEIFIQTSDLVTVPVLPLGQLGSCLGRMAKAVDAEID